MRLTLPATFLLGGLLGAAAAADPVRGHVISAQDAPLKTAPHGKASVRVLSGEAQSAFVGMLHIDPGVTIPVHRDTSEEFIYMLEGGGVIRIDGVESAVGPGDFVFMPAGAEVTFAATDAGPSRAIQVFAPRDSAGKYDSWR
jgi:quercetin dioxygenase-like cupin family protein